MQAKGVVGRTSAKDWNGRNGTVVLYSFQLEGSSDWYRTGSEKPNFNQGDFITFEYTEERGGKTVQLNTVVRSERQVVQAPAPTAYKGSGSKENWDARAAYWDAKEKREIEVVEPRISLAAARKDAIAVIGLALQHDALVFGNANKGAKLGIILGAVDEVTDRFYRQSMGQDKAAPAEAAAKSDGELSE